MLDRFLGAALGAGLFGLIAAALDARAAVTEGGDLWPAFLAIAGLVAPIALSIALITGIGRFLLVPDRFGVSLRRFLGSAGLISRKRAAVLFLAPLALLLLLLINARWALYLLSSELAPMAAGSALGLGVVISGATLAFAVAALARAFSEREIFARAPGVCLALSLSIVVVVFALMILAGETSGGQSVWTQFGVLRREELKLGAVGLLLLITIGAALGPAPVRPWQAALASALGVLPLGLTALAANVSLESPTVALSIERGAPLASRLLPVFRGLADADDDGFSAKFGGGDCDDDDPRRNPNEVDVPGNGIDEDCSGADAKPRALVAPDSELAVNARASAATKIPERLNVVLITIDTLRWDLGYAGYSRPISPRIDEFASESVVFERAYALASYTAKSLPPMLIGKYAGETNRGYSHFNRFDKELFVTERLKREGHRTVSVQGYWYFFQPPFGMERGFDVVNSSAAPRAAQLEGDRGWTSDKLSDAAISELGSLQDQRFFMWVHYTDPHSEYVEHEGFSFGKDSRARYDSEVAFSDHHVGRVLDALRKSPIWDRTAVIITSDHGEAFGEHGMIRHGFELWEELIRVPFIVRVPGFQPKRIAARRSLIDLVPTLLELYGAPPASGEGTDFTSGQSLVPDLAGGEGHQPVERPIFVDMSEGPHNAERRAFIENDLKLTTSNGRPLGLYDLSTDPDEKKDLSGERDRVAAAVERFKEFQRTLREVRVRRPK